MENYSPKILRDQLKGGFPERHKDLENRLAQNEVILLVAVFEDLVKSVHREVLKQNPKLLDGTRQIPLWEDHLSQCPGSVR